MSTSKKINTKYHLEIVNKFPDLEFLNSYTVDKGFMIVKYPCGCINDKVLCGNLRRNGTGSRCRRHGIVYHNSKTHEQFIFEVSLLSSNILVQSTYTKSREYVNIMYKDCQHTLRIEANSLLAGHSVTCQICNNIRMKPVDKFRSELPAGVELISEYRGANNLITVKYTACEHIHTADASSFIRGHNSSCHICMPHPSTKTPDVFINELKLINPKIEVLGKYINTKTSIEYRFTECGHEFLGTPDNLLHRGSGNSCSICNPDIYGKSECELAAFIQDNYTGELLRNDYKILKPKELDIVLPELKLAFEYNGIYWHSQVHKDKLFHYNKTDRCKSLGYKLIHVYEDEWVNKTEIVKSRILCLLGMCVKIYARRCTINTIGSDQASQFLNANHLRGSGSRSSINLGLFFLGELIAVQTFSTPKSQVDQEFELVRYCSKINTSVIGGASKLLNYFINNYKPRGIISYSDRGWSDGGLYKTLNFKYSHTTQPGYSYYKGLTKLSRYKFQKHKLKELFPSTYTDDKTEFQIMDEVGYLRVFDSGNDVWVM